MHVKLTLIPFKGEGRVGCIAGYKDNYATFYYMGREYI
jgi:hypothetical protein